MLTFPVRLLRLTHNISVHASGDVRLGEFDQWLLSLGDGTAPVVSGEDIIELPEDLCSVIDKADEKKSMTEFCEEIFPDINRNVGDEKWLEGRAVLAPTNHKYDDRQVVWPTHHHTQLRWSWTMTAMPPG